VASLNDYRKADAPLPAQYRAWELFGAGLESVGKNGDSSELDLRAPADNEVLLRVDALGICLSDIKIISQGGAHPRLRGRDLATEPTVLGHECSATVVAVGKNWADKFKPGERYIVQADIYYKGEGFAFGYLIRGGMAQYTYLDERALAGDEGCYLLPVNPATGYSQAALTEPWACVEMSYNLDERLKPGGNRILIATEDAPRWKNDYPMAEVVSNALEGVAEADLYDDIIITHPTVDVVKRLAAQVAPNGVMFLLGKPAVDGAVSVDVGAVHYQGKRYYGGADSLDALAEIHRRNDLLPGGSVLFVGAGGPMGQMHVQRAVEMSNGPALIVATDLDRGRLDHIVERFGPLATSKGINLVTVSPKDFDAPDGMDKKLRELAPSGFTDIAIMAPVAKVVAGHMTYAADNAFVNVFAGVGIGSFADFSLSDLCRGIKLIGSSGSRIADMQKVLEKVESSELNTNLSVAAIGGLNAAKDGLQAVKEARFPGKTVLYTQVHNLPLTPLEEVPVKFPELKDKLGPQGEWTKAAEEALLEKYL